MGGLVIKKVYVLETSRELPLANSHLGIGLHTRSSEYHYQDLVRPHPLYFLSRYASSRVRLCRYPQKYPFGVPDT